MDASDASIYSYGGEPLSSNVDLMDCLSLGKPKSPNHVYNASRGNRLVGRDE